MSNQWLPIFLKSVENEFSKPISSIQDKVTREEMQYILTTGSTEDEFDTLNTKKQFVAGLRKGQMYLEKQSCSLGTIIVIIPKDEPWKSIPWASWWRCIRLLSKNPVRILIFAATNKREFPAKGQVIEPKHINGGLAMQCDARSIVIYRREEVTRVLVHELFHASCSDPEGPIQLVESDCEAWAELMICAMLARGNYLQFMRHFNEQAKYAVKQAFRVEKYNLVMNENDYAWRYIVGRIGVWKSLGLKVADLKPEEKSRLKEVKSLRLTVRDY